MKTMSLHPRFFGIRPAFRLLCGLLLAGLLSPILRGEVFTVPKTIHMIGLDGESAESVGELDFGPTAIAFHSGDHTATIPNARILGYAMVEDDKALIAGTKGALAQAIPYGVGIAVSMTRPEAEVLTIFYRDQYQAIHGAVLVLPKDAGVQAKSSLDTSGIAALSAPNPASPLSSSIALATTPLPLNAQPSVVIQVPTSGGDGIPAAMTAAVYEQILNELTASKHFAHVWREGDTRRAEDAPAMVLRVSLESWKKGNARTRSILPLAGAADIKANVTLIAPGKNGAAHVIFAEDIEGSKHFKGESLSAAKSLAKHIRKQLEKSAPSTQAN